MDGCSGKAEVTGEATTLQPTDPDRTRIPMDWSIPAKRLSSPSKSSPSTRTGIEQTEAQLKPKADEEIRTLDPLLGKEMLYH